MFLQVLFVPLQLNLWENSTVNESVSYSFGCAC